LREIVGVEGGADLVERGGRLGVGGVGEEQNRYESEEGEREDCFHVGMG
jgi:hypothetical protein